MIFYYGEHSFTPILSSHVKLREVYQNTLRARHNPIFINTLEIPVVMSRDISLCQLGDDAIAVRLLCTPGSEIQFTPGAPSSKAINQYEEVIW
ncbi:hypothetical protein BCON_0077g00220 [Botryotinia convoluta]|uniref:Uncharacterized protein n=1 Tax=Botryotinia convoluta TaxID=54673 RepID=A0A4Z1I4F1_9HELO|nr:hypothetical protein BCON_0077g00220 [Botryotinia convoluta]